MSASCPTTHPRLPQPRRTSLLALAWALLRQGAAELFWAEAAVLALVVLTVVGVAPERPPVGLAEQALLVAGLFSLGFGLVYPTTMPTQATSGATRRQLATAAWAVDAVIAALALVACLVGSLATRAPVHSVQLVTLPGVVLLGGGTGRLLSVACRDLPKVLTPLWVVLALPVLAFASLWVLPTQDLTVTAVFGLSRWLLLPYGAVLAAAGLVSTAATPSA